MILSVIRFDIDGVEATRAAENAWKAYQKGQSLGDLRETSNAQSR
jgi:hypothetical protein